MTRGRLINLVVPPSYIAREWKDVPLMISYHTHIPLYARTYAPWLGSFGEWISWVC